MVLASHWAQSCRTSASHVFRCTHRYEISTQCLVRNLRQRVCLTLRLVLPGPGEIARMSGKRPPACSGRGVFKYRSAHQDGAEAESHRRSRASDACHTAAPGGRCGSRVRRYPMPWSVSPQASCKGLPCTRAVAPECTCATFDEACQRLEHQGKDGRGTSAFTSPRNPHATSNPRRIHRQRGRYGSSLCA